MLKCFTDLLRYFFFFKSPLPTPSIQPHGLRYALKASFFFFHKRGRSAAQATVLSAGVSPVQAAPGRRQAVRLGVPSKTSEGQRQVGVSSTLGRMATRFFFFERKDPFSKL